MTPRMEAKMTTVGELEDWDAGAIVSCLTHDGSEFQEEVMSRKDSPTSTPISLVFSDGCLIAWAASHQWRGMQTIEGFTRDSFRRRGVARLAACMLAASGSITSDMPTAVFSPHCVEIARSVGCRDVRLFERRGEDWTENS